MSQLRLDHLTGRWVVINARRGERPKAFLTSTAPTDDAADCPFCPAAELREQPILEVAGPNGWQVRVLHNLYPALYGDGPLAVRNLGPMFTQASGSGSHEVLIPSPEHTTSWADLDNASIDSVMEAIASRVSAHKAQAGLRYTQVIINTGKEAGASVAHPHAQLLGMPWVPRELVDEQAGFARFHGNCLLCAVVEAEHIDHRVVEEDDDAMVLCPFWSGTPFEMMIIPKAHNSHIYDGDLSGTIGVGRALRNGLQRLRSALGEVPYNVIFHAAPYRATGDFHWHLHVLPKLVTHAGFELGTGVLINIVAPETAADELRAAKTLTQPALRSNE